MFDLEEESFDQVAFAIECEITRDLRGSFSRRDDGDATLSDDGISERFRVVSFVSQHVVAWQARNQGFSRGKVTSLAWRADEPKRIAQRVDGYVDSVVNPAAERPIARASDSLFCPPHVGAHGLWWSRS